MVVGDAGTVGAIAVDDTNVYFVDRTANGTILSVPKGGGASTILAPQRKPDALASDGAALYWANAQANAIEECTVSGCNLAPRVLVPNQYALMALALDGPSLYWTASLGPDGGTVQACSATTCANSLVAVGHFGSSAVTELAAASGNVLWSDSRNGGALYVARHLTSEYTPPSVVNEVYATELAANAKSAFYVPLGSAVLSRTDLPTGTAVALGTSHFPESVVADGTYVVWRDYSQREVLRCRVDGCVGGHPEVLAENQDFPAGGIRHGVALDAKYVYFATVTAVKRVPR